MKVFVDGYRRGALNMAIDTALADWVANQEEEILILRFYRWNPPCLSLGRNQDPSVINTDYLKRMGFDLVRRPTGGMAVLHWKELTYAVVAKNSDKRLPRNVIASYLKISTALKKGLNDLGFPVEINDRRASKISHVCFQVPSVNELVISGRKLIGSAQTRRRGSILQHGSILLKAMPKEYLNCFSGLSDYENTFEKTKQGMIGLEDYSGDRVELQKLVDSLIKAFSLVFEDKAEYVSYKELGNDFLERLDEYERMFDSYEWNFERKTLGRFNSNR
ncbi:lipoate--protein ligase family protein [Kosmotoga pacifica]|uniref:lipoate--protein ligase family protein n=1 Tax=Kosmotoga pacifica TaxID=1330330 RepID=UPI00069A80D2|nr:biotin/lipoate A/B protein ligase family protein [Kosmotoga pacifica]